MNYSTMLILLTFTIILQLTLSHQQQPLLVDSAATSPRIIIVPNGENAFLVNAKYPSSKALTCQTSGDRPTMFDQLRWSGPNRLDNAEELKKRHKVTEEPAASNQWDLEFIKPTSDDSGTYYCTGVYHNTDKLNASIKVSIVNPLTLENCNDRQFLVEGRSNDQVTCRISADSPRVSILKDGKPLDLYNNRYKWNNDDSIDINGEVNQTDAGIYTIKIKDARGEKVEQNIHVEVHSKPQIHDNPNQPSYGIEGDIAKLECLAAGKPKPLVTWRDPKLRNLTQVGGYIVDQEKGILTINKVDRVADEGEFQCVANNNVGEAMQRVPLAVYTKPIIDTFINQTADEGSEVTFECRARAHPAPNFSIRKHGINQQPYQVGDLQTKDSTVDQDAVNKDLYIFRLKMIAHRTNFGLHYCNATNKAGTAEHYNQLFVRYKPDLSATPREQHVRLGKKISYTCHIKGYPKPQVIWKIDNTQVVNINASFLASPDEQTHIGTMSPPNPQQTALSTITCIATNDMGQTEQIITPKFTTVPGVVTPNLLGRSPTTIKLQLNVDNDGGDRIKYFKYRLRGATKNRFDALYNYPIDLHNETTIDASPNPYTEYTIRNLLPDYDYKIVIRAVNEVGEGDINEFHVDTLKPTKPEPPNIIKPVTFSSQHTTSGFPSQYSNGYLLEWGPPNLDNGDPITKYRIKYKKMTTDALNMFSSDEHTRIIEQMNERPLHARLGPLETNQRYGIRLTALNKYGESEEATLVIYTTVDRPPMPDLEAQILPWLMETSTPTLVVLLTGAIVCSIIIDLTFCFCFQMGFIHRLRGRCSKDKIHA